LLKVTEEIKRVLSLVVFCPLVSLEKNSLLATKAEFALFYFGGWPCNTNSFNKRIKEARKPGTGDILLEWGHDFNGFSNIRRL
jgi:hypothetical protein